MKPAATRILRFPPRLRTFICWTEDWLKRTVEALDGERFWYPKA
jgi:hypothetical protein